MKITSLSKADINKVNKELKNIQLFNRNKIIDDIKLYLLLAPVIFVIMYFFVAIDLKALSFSFVFCVLILIFFFIIRYYIDGSSIRKLKKDLINLKEIENISRVKTIDKRNSHVDLEDKTRLYTIYYENKQTNALTDINIGDKVNYRVTLSGYLIFKLNKM